MQTGPATLITRGDLKMDPGNAVLSVVSILARSPTMPELDLVAALEEEGVSHVHAEKLCAFVPSAFAWALLKRMGLQTFPAHYIAFDAAGEEVQLPFDREPYFTAALQLASDTLGTRVESGPHTPDVRVRRQPQR